MNTLAALLLLGAAAIIGAFGVIVLILILGAWETSGRRLAELVVPAGCLVLAYVMTVAALRMLRGRR